MPEPTIGGSSRAMWCLAAGVVLLGGCTAAPSETPHDANAALRPDIIVADREMASPGDFVSLTFPNGLSRGIMYVLEEEVGATWAYRFILLAGLTVAAPPRWYEPVYSPAEIPAIGVEGLGPDRVVIPEDATPGQYRICTGNAEENVCVRIEIVAP